MKSKALVKLTGVNTLLQNHWESSALGMEPVTFKVRGMLWTVNWHINKKLPMKCGLWRRFNRQHTKFITDSLTVHSIIKLYYLDMAEINPENQIRDASCKMRHSSLDVMKMYELCLQQMFRKLNYDSWQMILCPPSDTSSFSFCRLSLDIFLRLTSL